MQSLALAVVVIATGFVIILQDQRSSTVALGGHYLGLALLLLVRGFAAQIALAELVLGAAVCAILWPATPEIAATSAREQTDANQSMTRLRRARYKADTQDTPFNFFFLILMLALSGMVAYGLSNSNSTTSANATSGLNFAFYWLAIVGAFGIGTSRNPLRIGYGLLLILGSVETAYLAVGDAAQLIDFVAMAAAKLILAFAITRLAANSIEAGQARPETNAPSGFFFGRPEVSYATVLGATGLFAASLLTSDVFLSSTMLMIIGLVWALGLKSSFTESSSDSPPLHASQGSSVSRSSAATVTKFLAFVVVAGVCLQVGSILIGEYRIVRDPLLARIIVAFFAAGIASFTGALPFLWPFHWWISGGRHVEKTMFAATLISVCGTGGVALFVRAVDVNGWLLADPRAQVTLMSVGIIGAALAALIGFAQRDFHRLVMYSVASNAGIVLAGLSSGSYQGLVGGIVLAINQVLALWLLLLCSNAAGDSGGALKIDDLAFLVRQAPFAALGIGLGGLTLAGIPPLIGFVGRWTVYEGVSVHSTQLALLLIATSVLTFLGYVPVFGQLLVGLRIGGAKQRGWLAAITLLLALIPLATGLYPVPMLQAIGEAVRGMPLG